MNLDEFIQADIARTGKHVYTLLDVAELTERWIAMKAEMAAPFEGWRSDAEIDELLFGKPVEEVNATR